MVMPRTIDRWQLDPGLLMMNLEGRVLRSAATRANWSRQINSSVAQRRAAELVRSHFRQGCRREGRSESETQKIVEEHISDPQWIGRAHVARGLVERYKNGLTAFATAFRLTAGHPDSLRRQFDAMDLLGACEDYRVWRTADDLGLKYRRQIKELAQARHKNHLVKSLRAVARDLKRYRLALGSSTEIALAAAGLRVEEESIKDEARNDHEVSAVLDYWHPQIPAFPSMLATALLKLSEGVARLDREPEADFMRIGSFVFAHSNFPLAQMPRTGLAIDLVQMLSEMAAHPAGEWRPQHAEYRDVDRIRNNIPGPNYKVAAAFVSAALEIYYSSAAAAKAIPKFLARHDDFMIANWTVGKEVS
jgi:hypothetical protein